MKRVLILIQLVYLFSSYNAYSAPRVVDVADLDNSVKKAVFVDAQFNNTLSEPESQTKIKALLRTHGQFKIYKKSVRFWLDLDNKGDDREKSRLVIQNKPKSIKFLDPITKTLTDGYKGESVFELAFTQSHQEAIDASGKASIPLVVEFQACTDHVCLLPVAARVKIPIPTENPNEASEFSSVSDGESLIDRVLSIIDGRNFNFNSWIGIIVLLLAGILTAFTPCVYPVYIITIGIFSRWSTKSIALRMWLLVAFCIGMILSYALLGVITVSSGALFGSLAQTPIFLIGIGALIALSAVFFSGYAIFPMPSFVTRWVSRPQDLSDNLHLSGPKRLKQIINALIMGAGLGVVAAPCIGPVLMALLVWLSANSAVDSIGLVRGFFLLSVFGLGMSAPLLILGTLIIKFKKNLPLGRFTAHIKHFGSAVLFVSSFFFLVPGFKILLKPDVSNKEFVAPYKIHNYKEWKQNGRAVIDFRADWCAPCIQLEEETFSHSIVTEEFSKGAWTMVRVDLTTSSEEKDELLNKFGVVGVPTVLLTNAEGKICDNLRLFGFENAKDFLLRMKKVDSEC